MRKVVILVCIILLFIGCKSENLPPNDSLPIINSDKTYLEIKNTSQFDINIYFDSSLSSSWSKVSSGETINKEVNLYDIDNKIFIEYEYNIDSITIPFFDSNNIGCVKTIPIKEKEVNKLEISKLSSLSFDTKTYLIIQNKTSDYIYIEEQSFDKNNKIYQNISDEYWINPQGNAVYNISEINLKNCYIINGNKNLNLDLGLLKSGRVYTVCYNGNDVSVVSLDLGLNPKDDKGLPIYVISSVEDLINISKYNDVNATFELTRDIEGNGVNWKPIDTFKGTLIGNGFSVNNFVINSESGLGKETLYPNGSSHLKKQYYRPAYCGFFYKNLGIIKNIFFKNITVEASFEYQTDERRHVYVGTIAGHNSGAMKNIHLENINLRSVLNHQKNQNGTPLQMNVTGGIVGENYGEMSFCSIKNSYINASTDAKKNYCDTRTYVGGVSGEVYGNISDILVEKTFISASSRGGFWGGLWGDLGTDDGLLISYAGSVFGLLKTTKATKIVSYKNTLPSATATSASNNPVHDCSHGTIVGKTDDYSFETLYFINTLEELESSPVLDWENWSTHRDKLENCTDFLY